MIQVMMIQRVSILARTPALPSERKRTHRMMMIIIIIIIIIILLLIIIILLSIIVIIMMFWPRTGISPGAGLPTAKVV